MREQIIATRYARALLQAAKPDALEQIERDLLGLKQIYLDRATGLRSVMMNPAFHMAERLHVMAKLAEVLRWQPTFIKLVNVLVQRGRVQYIALIADAFVAAFDAKSGRIRATLSTSQPLDDSEKQKLIHALQERAGKQIVAQMLVDPRLLGGVKVNIGGQVFDGTVAAQLQSLQKVLSQTVGL